MHMRRSTSSIRCDTYKDTAQPSTTFSHTPIPHTLTHTQVVLNQAAERPAPFARIVAPLMSRRGLLGGSGGAGGAPRPRFAYRTEV